MVEKSQASTDDALRAAEGGVTLKTVMVGGVALRCQLRSDLGSWYGFRVC